MKWKDSIGKRVQIKFGCYNHPKQIEEGIVKSIEGDFITIKRDDGSKLGFMKPNRKSDEVKILS